MLLGYIQADVQFNPAFIIPEHYALVSDKVDTIIIMQAFEEHIN